MISRMQSLKRRRKRFSKWWLDRVEQENINEILNFFCCLNNCYKKFYCFCCWWKKNNFAFLAFFNSEKEKKFFWCPLKKRRENCIFLHHMQKYRTRSFQVHRFPSRNCIWSPWHASRSAFKLSFSMHTAEFSPLKNLFSFHRDPKSCWKLNKTCDIWE